MRKRWIHWTLAAALVTATAAVSAPASAQNLRVTGDTTTEGNTFLRRDTEVNGSLNLRRPSDGCNSAVLNLWDTSDNRGWHITNRHGCEGSYNDLKFFFFDGYNWTKTMVLSGARVGIGIEPAQTLDVNGAARIRGAYQTIDSAGNVLDQIGAYAGWNPTTVYIAGRNRTNTSLCLPFGKCLPAWGASAVAVGGYGGERLFVDLMSGRVGIGTTAPGARLEVAGDIRQTGCQAGAALVYPNLCVDTADRPIATIDGGQLTCVQAGGHMCREDELIAVCTRFGVGWVTTYSWMNESIGDDVYKYVNNAAPCTNIDGSGAGRWDARPYRCCYGIGR